MNIELPEMLKLIMRHSSDAVNSSQSKDEGKPLMILNIDAYDEINELVDKMINEERIKYAIELRDMDSHTAMDNIIETASKGE